MKWGALVSVGMVVVFCLVMFVSMFGFADSPTSRTKPAKLVVMPFPDNLPAIYTPSNPDADANLIYTQAFKFYDANHAALSNEPPDKELAQQLTKMMIDAMNAGNVSQPFLDDQVPMSLAEDPKYGDALWMIPQVVMFVASQHEELKEKTEAVQAAKAAFALSHRAFTKSVRYENRGIALELMKMCGNTLDGMAEDPALSKKLQKYAVPLSKIEKHWNDKREVIGSIKPHIGDLVNMALNEKDLTLRVHAVRWLAIGKFRPQTKGNARAIMDAIQTCKADPNPQIRQAAEMAENFTIEEYRKIK